MMRKFVIALMVLALCSAAFAQTEGMGDMKGRMMVGGFFNYAFGFGDQFKDYEETIEDITIKAETSLGFSFGGQFFYGIAPKILIGVIVDWQQIKYKGSAEGDLGGFEDLFNYDEKESWIAINPAATLLLSPDKKLCPVVQAGPGYYMPSHEDADAKPGVFAGIGILYMVSPTMAVDAGGRFHMIFTEDKSTTYVEAHGGVSFFFGGTN